jgi:hypothetical protein
LSTARGVTPIREALSRSMVTKVSTPFSDWSLSTSVITSDRAFIASASLGAQAFSASLESLVRVY